MLFVPMLEVGFILFFNVSLNRMRSLDDALSKLVVSYTPFQTLSQRWLLPVPESGMAFYAFSTCRTPAQLINTSLLLSHGLRLLFFLESQQNEFTLFSAVNTSLRRSNYSVCHIMSLYCTQCLQVCLPVLDLDCLRLA